MYESGNTVFPLSVGRIARAELERSARLFGSGYAFEGAEPAPEEAVLAGRFNTRVLRPGLILHATEVRDLHDMRTRHTLHHSGIKIIVVADGITDIAFGRRRFRLGPRAAGRNAPDQGVLLSLTEPTTFARRWERGRAERKVSLTLTPDWLEQSLLNGSAAPADLRRFAGNHLDCRIWNVTPRAREFARQILAPDAYLPGLHRLRLECRCIDLTTEALAALVPAPPVSDWLSAIDRGRLARLDELLHEDVAADMSVADIARIVGSNPTSLQALARRAWGATVFERLRAIRMEKARALLVRGAGVGQAAEAAGYASATNFATAYRRQFGITPRQSRARF
jgi:AraC-like DNA-binding protein